MQKEDYLLKEIEKIGVVIEVIRQKLFGGKTAFAIKINQQQQEAKNVLLNEINFDIDIFINQEEQESINYLKQHEGFSTENIEELANCLADFGISGTNSSKKLYIKKALQLYLYCNTKTNTYSIAREEKIANLQLLLTAI